jgi:uncharacterized membrane protein YedE/YeeE
LFGLAAGGLCAGVAAVMLASGRVESLYILYVMALFVGATTLIGAGLAKILQGVLAGFFPYRNQEETQPTEQRVPISEE